MDVRLNVFFEPTQQAKLEALSEVTRFPREPLKPEFLITEIW